MDIPKAQSHTPLMRQYWEIKEQHLDKILLFRMGDFYEMFFDDAVQAAPILNIALTSRSKAQGQEVAMCGVPYHSIGPQINKLLKAGLKVAICDQMEAPSAGKKIVRRAVTRVVTPGLVYDPETLEQTDSNFVAAVSKMGEKYELAALEGSTGEIVTGEDLDLPGLLQWIDKLSPKEFIVAQKTEFPFLEGRLVTERSLESASSVADYLVKYARETQGDEILKVLREPEKLSTGFLKLSPQTIRHLEIFKRTDGEKDFSLCWAIDLTKTPMGGRLLRKRLATPFGELEQIDRQLDKIEYFYLQSEDRDVLRSKLSKIGDLERKVGRLCNSLCNSRDLQSLGFALREAQSLWENHAWNKLFPYSFSKLESLIETVLKTLRDELPHSTKEGGMIRDGINGLLDEYIDLDTHAQKRLSDLEAREKQQTGITSLKIKYNSVFGYSFEVTKSNLDKVPGHFVRRQTIAQGERFISQELSELEEKILSAKQKRCDLEFQLFSELRGKLLDQALEFLKISSLIADVDLASSMAELARQQNYTRPSMKEQAISLHGSRHPVLEKSLSGKFISNDVILDRGRCLLLTGPNMAGKSTLMRQVALTALLAHCGFYVPAEKAELPLLKQIFTRIGAQDNVAQGLSTFMVEMTETAEIIKAATPDSLVVLDEIGRGTSTYDGMSLAQAILEYFISDVKSFTFFATHYHELTHLAAEQSEIENAHMSIQEHKGQLVFLRKLKKGPANRSYGIDVAKQAGLPKDIIEKAQKVLDGLIVHSKELQGRQMNLLDRVLATPEVTPEGAPQVPERLLLLAQNIKNLQINGMTPLDALNCLSTFQTEIRDLDS